MTIESVNWWCKKIKEETRVSCVEAKICSNTNSIVFTLTNKIRDEVFSVKYAVQIFILQQASISAKVGEKNAVNILRKHYQKLTSLGNELVKTSNAK